MLVVGGGCGEASRPDRTIVGSVLRRLILLLLFLSIVACVEGSSRREKDGKKERTKKKGRGSVKGPLGPALRGTRFRGFFFLFFFCGCHFGWWETAHWCGGGVLTTGIFGGTVLRIVFVASERHLVSALTFTVALRARRH